MATTYNQGIKLSHTGAQVDNAVSATEGMVVASTAAMVALTPPSSNVAVVIGSGVWAWVSGDSTTPDDEFVFASTVSSYATAGRWKLVAPYLGQSSAPTTADGSTIDNTYGAEEAGVLSNIRTRQAEIIACLQNLGLMDT